MYLIRLEQTQKTGFLLVWSNKCFSVRPNKKKSLFQVTDLKILDRVGTYVFFLQKKKINDFMHFERHFAFQNA